MPKEFDQKLVDQIAGDIGTTLTNCAGKNRLPEEVYVLITRNDGKGDSIFTAPYSLRYLTSGTGPGPTRADRLADIGWLHDHIHLRTHLASVMNQHPNVALILDDQTAARLTGEGLQLILRDSENHCMLTGLRDGAIDVFIETPARSVHRSDGVTTIVYGD